jgi:hypothetical protein
VRYLGEALRDCVRDPELYREGPQAVLNAVALRMQKVLVEDRRPAPPGD